MWSKNRISQLAILSTALLAAGNFGCGGGQSATPSNTTTAQISVSITPLAAQSVDEGQTMNFTANVVNDSANKGVTWTVSCATAPCGTVSPTATASGTPTTYTAPGSVSANLPVTITATSVADSTKSAKATATVQAISVSVSPTTAHVLDQGQTANFTANVVNDSANKGVTWTVLCATAPCGTVSPTATASGAATTYTAPNTVAANLSVTITATSVTDSTKSAPGSVTVMALSVSVSPSTAQTVDPGQFLNFIATVANDSSNKGVTWTVSCSTAPCGTVAPATTASGAATAYTAPNTVATNRSVTITATSVADPTKTGSASINVPGITVIVSPTTATLQAGTKTQFTAMVANDAANKGVAWTVTCPTALCGAVSPTPTASGAATTYSAPAAAPTSNLTVTLTAASVTNPAASASATITVPGITVSISPSSASVPSGGTQQFTATVSNDPSNGGVTWSLLAAFRQCFRFNCGPIFFRSCTTCGTVSPTSTASGAPTSYTAPAHFTRPLGGACGFSCVNIFFGVNLQATSVTNSGALSRAGITILPISVSVSPTSASVVVNATQQFTATVTNDGANGGAGAGVTWTLTQNGVACSRGCGTIAPTNTASGVSTTYTAPATVPALAVVMLTATAVTDGTKAASATITVTNSSGAACGAGSGNESLLKGQYAFLLQGFDSNGNMAAWGSFTADGTGKITGGEEDIHRAPGLQTDVSINTTGSSYSVGADHRGCLTLAITNGGTTYFRFALGSINPSNIATMGHIIEFDDTTGTGTRAAGTIRLQDPTSFMASQFKGNYTFGLSGGFNGRFAMAGTLTSDGTATLTGTNFDINAAGTPTSNIASAPAGNFTCCSVNGRGAMQISTSVLTINFVLYMINSSDVFLVSTDVSIVGGEAIAAPGPFSMTSLNGAAVLRKTAQSSTGPIVDIATASANGTGAITVNDSENNVGTFTTSSTALNYIVASNGRVTLTGGSTPPVLYLYGTNQGFLVGTDANVEFGVIESQAAGPFSDASLSGAYMFGTENPSAASVTLESGVATLDGTGNVTGTSDQSNSTGLTQNQSLSFPYSVLSNGTGTFGSGTTAIFISGNKLVFINNASTTPTIIAVEK